MAEFRLETERLILRSWRRGDVDAFLEVNSDPEVMATLGPVMSRPQVSDLVDRMIAREAEDGMTFWALERREDDLLIGWCGVGRGRVEPIVGKAEIGWRMRRDCWGNGYVTEGAAATLDWLFATCDDEAAYAITHTGNTRSRAVMERLKMAYQPALDFAHPSLAADDPLRPHVTYAVSRDEWCAGRT